MPLLYMLFSHLKDTRFNTNVRHRLIRTSQRRDTVAFIHSAPILAFYTSSFAACCEIVFLQWLASCR